jgi:hypothetical protein
MSRSGYSDEYDYDPWGLIKWRGAVASAIRGRRGQAFLKEMLQALDVLTDKRLISCELETPDGAVCALGAVGKLRSLDMSGIDPTDRETVAATFGLANALVSEITYENDEGIGYWVNETPEARFQRMRAWVAAQIKGGE